MSTKKCSVGDRVYAISCVTADAIYLYGFGVYEGDFEPTEAFGWLADEMRQFGFKNPRIRLDSGEVVYGCECWWGAEEKFQKHSLGLFVTRVSITQERRSYELTGAYPKYRNELGEAEGLDGVCKSIGPNSQKEIFSTARRRTNEALERYQRTRTDSRKIGGDTD